MSRPTEKKIGNLTVNVDAQGWPRWTRIESSDGCGAILNEEQARDLHYALCRIVDYLDEGKRLDISRGVHT